MLVVLTGATVTTLARELVDTDQELRANEAFEGDVRARAAAIELGMREELAAFEATAIAISVADGDPGRLAAPMRQTLLDVPSLRCLAVVEAVNATDLDTWVAARVAEGRTNYTAVEWVDGELVPASNRSVHQLVRHREAQSCHPSVEGLDLAADAIAAPLIARAVANDALSISSVTDLIVGNGTRWPSVYVATPIHMGGTHDGPIMAVLLGHIQVHPFHVTSLQGLDLEGIDIIVQDLSSNDAQRIIHVHPGGSSSSWVTPDRGLSSPIDFAVDPAVFCGPIPQAEFNGGEPYRTLADIEPLLADSSVTTVEMDVADHTWAFTFRADEAFVHRTKETWILTSINVVGAVLTLALTTYLVTVLLSNRRLGRLTGELVATNASLEHEMEERTALERQLVQSQKMEAVGRLAGGVAHDFNNLLTVIMGHSELIALEAEGDTGVQEDIGEVLDAAERAKALTSQLLAFSRLGGEEERPTRLDEVVSGLAKMLPRLVGERVTVEVDVAPTQPVLIDPNRFEQVVLNLVVNARDAMPDGGCVRLRIAPEGADQVRFSVTDEGHGMDEVTKARIFEPFFTTKPSGQGTGLGLSTVFGIVEHAGGTVEVDSTPGRGTTFEVRLPVTDAAVPDAAEAAEVAVPTGGRARILVAEDNDAVRALAARLLRGAGHTVLTATDGLEALELGRRELASLDLVISDVLMPRMNGTEVTRLLRQERPDLPVIHVSGHPHDAAGNRLVEADDGPLIQKPFQAAELLAAVADALDGDGPEA